jgi:hypothetical protein
MQVPISKPRRSLVPGRPLLEPIGRWVLAIALLPVAYMGSSVFFSLAASVAMPHVVGDLNTEVDFAGHWILGPFYLGQRIFMATFISLWIAGRIARATPRQLTVLALITGSAVVVASIILIRIQIDASYPPGMLFRSGFEILVQASAFCTFIFYVKRHPYDL